MWADKIKEFLKPEKYQIAHFIVLIALTLISAFLLNFQYPTPGDRSLIPYVLAAFLVVELLPVYILTYLTGGIIGAILSAILKNPQLLTCTLYLTGLGIGLCYLWVLSGLLSVSRKRNKDASTKELKSALKWLIKLAPFIAIMLIGLTILWQLGVYKPAVYLYPEKDMNVSVKVEINGRLTETIPEYGGGWNVLVHKGGKIEGGYDYLFYEGALNRLERPDSGWIVEYENLNLWFDEKLPQLGLNEAEGKEFKKYWLGKLPQKKYYQIGLLSDEFLREDMNLIVEPKPDTEIRLIFYFKPLDEKLDLPEPALNKKERYGFTVVEWGGVVDLNPIERMMANLQQLV